MTQISSKGLIAAGLMVAFTLPACGSNSATGDVPSPPPDVVITDDEDLPSSRPEAIEALVNTHGISVLEAEFQLGFQGAIVELREELAASFPDDYAGVWVDRKPFQINVAFTNDAEARVEELRSGFTGGEYLNPYTAGHSITALYEVANLLVDGKHGTGDLLALEGKVFDVSVDLQQSKVVVVTEDPFVTSTILNELRSDIVVVEAGRTTTTRPE